MRSPLTRRQPKPPIGSLVRHFTINANLLEQIAKAVKANTTDSLSRHYIDISLEHLDKLRELAAKLSARHSHGGLK